MSDDAAERTEEATSRRREKERERGNIAKSQDLTSALMVTVGLALLGIFALTLTDKIEYMLVFAFTHIHPTEMSHNEPMALIMPFARMMGEIMLPFMLFLLVCAIVIVRMQVGNVFAPSRAKFDPENLSPKRVLKNLKRLFSPVEPRSMVEFIKSLIKMIVIAACGFSVLNGNLDKLYGLLGADVDTAFAVIGKILSDMLINICLAMLVLGILDRRYQTWEYEKSIKMTKQEVKDEMKDIDGDPKIKAKVRAIQMQMAQQRMMSAIPTADVVVTNPTHYAVAIKYDKEKAPAPIVVAKGIDFVAFKIKEVAQNNGVPIVENRPIARALYNSVPIDGIIPSDMFVAVAEILAYVYNQKKR